MNPQDAIKALLDLPDEDLEKISFTLPSIIIGNQGTDADGFSIYPEDEKEEPALNRQVLQKDCWDKFNRNPQVNTSVRGMVGRITGMGFEATSEILEIQEVIEEIELDWRNRLYNYWRAYVGRAVVEGELYLILTCHPDGFIEVDFSDPSTLDEGGDDDTGIIFHPRKTTLPIFYTISKNGEKVEQIPSIYVAMDSNLVNEVNKHDDYSRKLQTRAKSRKHAFRPLGGFYRFVLAWDRGFVTRRAISYLRTTLEWLNHYEDLKKYEIDHKKASGAYAWVVTFEDAKAFKLWMSLSEEEQKKTALMQNIQPGSRLFVPPGMKIEAKNPNLPNISNQDTDILQMVTSGLNEASDVTTGTVGGTYASVAATRGPMADRTSDEVEWFDRFYKYDFWGAIFWLKHKLAGFPAKFEVEEVVGFDNNGKEIMGKRKKLPAQLIETSYPISETSEIESMTKAFLGSKHGPLPESIGIPPSAIAKRLSFGSYGRNRLRKATEDKKYPSLVYSVDSDVVESVQEKTEGEKPKDKNKDKNNDAKNKK